MDRKQEKKKMNINKQQIFVALVSLGGGERPSSVF